MSNPSDSVPSRYRLHIVIKAPNSVLDQLTRIEQWIIAFAIPIACELRNREVRVCYVITGRKYLLDIAATLATAMPEASFECFAVSNDLFIPSETATYSDGGVTIGWTGRDFNTVLRNLDIRWYKGTTDRDESGRGPSEEADTLEGAR